MSVDNAQRMYKALELPDVAAANMILNQWAKQGWVLDRIDFCMRTYTATDDKGKTSTAYANWYLAVMSKSV